MFWQKRKVKESIPEEIIKDSQASVEGSDKSDGGGKSTDTPDPSARKKKLNWVINMIVETIEETVECDPVTVKIKKPKVD